MNFVIPLWNILVRIPLVYFQATGRWTSFCENLWWMYTTTTEGTSKNTNKKYFIMAFSEIGDASNFFHCQSIFKSFSNIATAT